MKRFLKLFVVTFHTMNRNWKDRCGSVHLICYSSLCKLLFSTAGENDTFMTPRSNVKINEMGMAERTKVSAGESTTTFEDKKKTPCTVICLGACCWCRVVREREILDRGCKCDNRGTKLFFLDHGTMHSVISSKTETEN